MLTFDSGNQTTNAEFKKGKHNYECVDLLLMPSQRDLEKRASFKLSAGGSKRRKTTEPTLSALSKICGRENAMIMHHPDFPPVSKPFKYITAPGLLASSSDETFGVVRVAIACEGCRLHDGVDSNCSGGSRDFGDGRGCLQAGGQVGASTVSRVKCLRRVRKGSIAGGHRHGDRGSAFALRACSGPLLGAAPPDIGWATC